MERQIEITSENLSQYLEDLRGRLTQAILSSRASDDIISALFLLVHQVNLGDFASQVGQKVKVSTGFHTFSEAGAAEQISVQRAEQISDIIVENLGRKSIDQIKALAPVIEELMKLKGIAVLSFRTQVQSIFNDVLRATLSLSEEGLDVCYESLLRKLSGRAKISADRTQNENGSLDKPLMVDDDLYDYIKSKCRRVTRKPDGNLPSLTLRSMKGGTDKLILFVSNAGTVNSCMYMEVKTQGDATYDQKVAEARTVTAEELQAGDTRQPPLFRRLWRGLTQR